MIKTNKNKLNLLLVMAALTVVSLFVSCSKIGVTKSSSFTAGLELVDECIENGDVKKAVSLLKKTVRSASSVYDRIGVYNRYMTLGETELAEKVLVKACKKFPDNLEINAVYTHFLIAKDDLEKALVISKKLRGTDYESLYAETVLRLTLENNLTADEVFDGKRIKETKKNKAELDELRSHVFYDPRFVDIYMTSYKISHNPIWQVNAASLFLHDGNLEKAASFYDGAILTPFQSLFWGMALYDCGYYAKSLEALKQSETLGLNDNVMLTKILALQADNYHILGDDKSGKDLRASIIAINNEDLSPEVEKILPLVYLNESRYGHIHEDYAQEYSALIDLINIYPDYAEGLSGLALYALNLRSRPQEDRLSAELRQSGLRTLEMEKADAVPVVQLTDILDKLDNALYFVNATEEHDKIAKASSFVILRHRLNEIIDPYYSDRQNVSRVWSMLENYTNNGISYPADVVRYSCITLLKYNFVQEARDLFMGHIKSTYGTDDLEKLTLWEKEFYGYFSILDKNAADGIDVYKAITDKYSRVNTNMISKEQLQSVINAYVNLGVIYSSLGDDSLARECYNNASAICSQSNKKAEILCRLAVADVTLGNVSSAVRELKYALTLDDSLNKARIMLKKLNAEEY